MRTVKPIVSSRIHQPMRSEAKTFARQANLILCPAADRDSRNWVGGRCLGWQERSVGQGRRWRQDLVQRSARPPSRGCLDGL